MSDRLFSSNESLGFEARASRHVRKAVGVALKSVATAGVGVGMTAIAGVEFELFHGIFELVKGPATPGETVQWSANILAMTGMVMMGAYHVHAKSHPDSMAVKVVEFCAGFMLPVYAVGAGLAFAAVIAFNGADVLVAQAADASRALFSAPKADVSTPLLDHVIATFPTIFSVACGGLSVVTMSTMHRLADVLQSNVQTISALRRAASEARAALSTIRRSQARFSELARKRDYLLSQDQRAHEVAAAHEISTAITTAVRDYETWLTNQQVLVGAADRPFTIPHSNLEPEEVAKRVAALRAITAKSILASLRALKE